MLEERRHTLPDGTRLELLYLSSSSPERRAEAEAQAQQRQPGEACEDRGPAGCVPAAGGGAPLPALLFVHGAFHGAWCWLERWMPFFAAAGHDCYAVSLRGHGASELCPGPAPSGSAAPAGTAASHADDLASLIAALQLPSPPVLVCHSAAGTIAAHYVSQPGPPGHERPRLAGLALVGAAPPSGNSGTVKRTMRTSPLRVARIAWCFIRQSFRTSPSACRFLFFSPDLPAADLEQYQAKLAAAPHVTLIAQERRRSSSRGGAGLPAGPPTPAGWPGLPPERVFVGRGSLDVLVDGQADVETAAFYGLPPEACQTWAGVGHDCMLDARWQEVAEAVLAWLRALPAV